VCVITGGTGTGLGFNSAGEIASKPGYEVVIARRGVSRAGLALSTHVILLLMTPQSSPRDQSSDTRE
jgi:hypothetical protein